MRVLTDEQSQPALVPVAHKLKATDALIIRPMGRETATYALDQAKRDARAAHAHTTGPYRRHVPQASDKPRKTVICLNGGHSTAYDCRQ